MRYVFDLDGTLCTQTDGDYTRALPLVKRIEVVNKLFEEGNHISIHTARGMSRYKNDRSLAEEQFRKLTENQLKSWGVKYHEIFLGKPAADVYIDDKAMKDNDYFEANREQF